MSDRLHLSSTTSQFLCFSLVTCPYSHRIIDKKETDNMTTDYNYEFFNVTFPQEWVAHVEINRPEKMNAFKEM
jgi:hypothetical protein